MRLILLFLRRYLLVKQRTYAINIISWVAIIGLAIGAASIIVLLSSFNALETMIYDSQVNFRPEILIESNQGRLFDADSVKDDLEKVSGVEHVSEVYEGYAFLQIPHTYMDSSATKNVVVRYRGVDKNYDEVYALSSIVTEGIYTSFEEDSLALYMGRNLFVENKLYFRDWPHLFTPTNQTLPEDAERWNGYVRLSTPGEASLGRRRPSVKLQPMGLFLTGDEQFDVHYVLGDIDHLRNLHPNHQNLVTQIGLSLDAKANLSEVKQDIQAALGDDFNVLDRRDQDASVYRIVKLERFFMVFILAFIVGIISFNVIAALSMLIMEKRHDIIMLRALGAERKTIFSLYLFQGMFGAAIATILGIGIGALIVMAQDRFGFIHFPQPNPEAMPIPYPVDLRFMDVLLIAAIILGITCLASLFPAWRASKIE